MDRSMGGWVDGWMDKIIIIIVSVDVQAQQNLLSRKYHFIVKNVCRNKKKEYEEGVR